MGELKIVPQGHEPAQNGENRVATGLERLKNGLGTGNNHDPDTPRRSGREKREISGGVQPKTGIFTANGREWTQMGSGKGISAGKQDICMKTGGEKEGLSCFPVVSCFAA